jgi:threonine synthase
LRYFSTANRNHTVSLQEAVLNGMPADRGLYMPESLPRIPEKFFRIVGHDLQELAFEIAKALLGEDVPMNVLRDTFDDAINFETPLVELLITLKHSNSFTARP